MESRGRRRSDGDEPGREADAADGCGCAEDRFGLALPPHDEAAEAEGDQADDRKEADELIGEAEELAFVGGDAGADDAVEPGLGLKSVR